ncbi:MAG: pyridoxal phosphate-dependent aminotransferase [Lachnospiraceae bacterium]
MYYVNEDIKNCVRIFPEQGRYDYARYDMNENPEGLPKEFVDEVLKEITPEFLATYPEHDQFRQLYADYIGVKPENVAVTNGSDMAIRFIMEFFAEKGSSVVTVTPSFEMYAVNCSMLGLKHVPVPYEADMTMDADKIAAAIDENTDIVVLLNPNNPIGTVYTDEEAERIIKRAGEVGAVVIVDEAYHYFYRHTFLPLIHKYDNVVVLRTFSKLFSLAAVRLGMMIANEELIGYARKGMPTFEVNAVALKFGEHLMRHTEIIDQLMEEEAEGKAYIVEELAGAGYKTYVSHGNFVFIAPKRPAAEVKAALKEKKILVKTYGNEFLKDYIRISTGSKKSMKFFLDAFLETDN